MRFVYTVIGSSEVCTHGLRVRDLWVKNNNKNGERGRGTGREPGGERMDTPPSGTAGEAKSGSSNSLLFLTHPHRFSRDDSIASTMTTTKNSLPLPILFFLLLLQNPRSSDAPPISLASSVWNRRQA